MHACPPVGQQFLGSSSSLHPPAPEPACTPLPKPAEQAAVHALFHSLARPLALVNCCMGAGSLRILAHWASS
jgi:hypothetical protein